MLADQHTHRHPDHIQAKTIINPFRIHPEAIQMPRNRNPFPIGYNTTGPGRLKPRTHTLTRLRFLSTRVRAIRIHGTLERTVAFKGRSRRCRLRLVGIMWALAYIPAKFF